MQTVNSFFDHVYCINLERRGDRKQLASQEFEKFDIRATFSKAVDGKDLPEYNITSSDGLPVKPGDMGCVLSHLQLVQFAEDARISRYLVFEDDVELHADFKELFDKAASELPYDWDMFYLGGSHMGPITQVSEHIFKISRTFTTHAIGVNHTAYPYLLDVWQAKEKVDLSLSALHSILNCYVVRPHIAYQRAGYSDILEAVHDYQHLRK